VANHDHQQAEATGSAQQAVQQSGVQINLFIGATQARAIAASAPPLAVPHRAVPVERLHGRDELLGRLTWWVQAETSERMRAAFYSVAFAAGAAETDFDHAHPADVLWHTLTSLSAPWMLVIDGADNPREFSAEGRPVEDGTDWLRPETGPFGRILVSSRDGRSDHWANWIELCAVESLFPEDGARVLRDLAPHAGTGTDAASLSTALGGLPLALDLAGKYLASVANNPFPGPDAIETFADYQAVLEERIAQLGPSGREMGSSRRTLTTTWEISLDLLARQGDQLARPLIRLLACTGPDPLPHQVFLDVDTMLESGLFPDATYQWVGEALTALDGLGLITIARSAPVDGIRSSDPWSQTITMHPLVRAITRVNSEASGVLDAFVDLFVRLITIATEKLSADRAGDWPHWATLASHCFAPFEVIGRG
jgi:hypothetical protein